MEILIWVGLVFLACAGTVARTVADAVRDLQPTLMAIQAGRLRSYKLAGGVLGAIALAAASALVVMTLWHAQGDILVAALGAGLSALLVLIAEEMARGIAHRQMDRLARPFLGDAAAFLPLIEPRPESAEPEEVRSEALEQMVEAGEKAGLIESDEHEMITGVIRLDRTAVREIMVPRIDVVGVNVELPLRTALDVIIAGSHSRVPVYEDSLDHVVGLLYAKDLIRILRDGQADVALRSVLRPPHFVPESKPLDELLQELQQSKVHMAIVVDEYGGTAGIVTIEDVLEEIVGEIQDEYDIGEEPLMERVADNEGVFDARVSITDVNDALSTNLPAESDTLGGLVYQRLQKMPKVGDQMHVDDVTISVLSVVGRRIKKVRVVRAVSSEQLPVNSSTEMGS
ncbi:MAG: HlyC/CorC family transporter [Chloroflexi bacterium]|nr:HlyC/CorC family transporter [Chloroflexota bacterium]